jgi:hypothetical protein
MWRLVDTTNELPGNRHPSANPAGGRALLIAELHGVPGQEESARDIRNHRPRGVDGFHGF